MAATEEIGGITLGAGESWVRFRAGTAVAYWGLGWSVQASWLARIAMSTTSVAVVYAVMLEFGFNATCLVVFAALPWLTLWRVGQEA